MEFNISWLGRGHPVLNIGDLSIEASHRLGLLLDLLRFPTVKSLGNSVIIVLIKRYLIFYFTPYDFLSNVTALKIMTSYFILDDTCIMMIRWPVFACIISHIQDFILFELPNETSVMIR